jgi:cobyrinic acid a,c-diamide synthase
MTAVPRLVVSAPSSGHGKTAVAVGLLAAFAGSGLNAAGFKVGPDHTDAAYLGLAAGRPGRNLDPRLVGPGRVAPLFTHGAAGADIAVVEGTMGLFDSLAGRSEADSTAGVAGLLRAPVLLVVDVAATGQSVAALVHGFRSYDELTWLGGVILNRVASDRHEQLLREALDEIGVPVFGALRRGDLASSGPAALPERSHGVVPVLHRAIEATRAVRRLGETIAAAVDLEGLLSLAGSAPRLGVEPWSAAEATAEATDPGRAGGQDLLAGGRSPRIALAGAPGRAYGYVETAELLVAAGAEVITVDPLRDEALPADTDALVVCGGLPESYAEELSANVGLRSAVAELAHAGRPVLAEGTGLLWLSREFDGRPMCGVLDAIGVTTERMVVGYREATARASTPVAPLGARVVGYKQHRSEMTPRAGQTPAWTWGGGAPEGFVWRRVHASHLTLHWAGTPEIARRLVAAAAPVGPSEQPSSADLGFPSAATAGRTRTGAGSRHTADEPPTIDTDQNAGYGGPVAPGIVPAQAGRRAPDEATGTAALTGPTLAVPTTGGAPPAGGAPSASEARPGRVPLRVEYLGDVGPPEPAPPVRAALAGHAQPERVRAEYAQPGFGSPGLARPGEAPDPARTAALQPGPAQTAALQPGPAQTAALQPGPAQTAALQPGPAQTAYPRPTQAHAGPAQPDLGGYDPAEAGSPDHDHGGREPGHREPEHRDQTLAEQRGRHASEGQE